MWRGQHAAIALEHDMAVVVMAECLRITHTIGLDLGGAASHQSRCFGRVGRDDSRVASCGQCGAQRVDSLALDRGDQIQRIGIQQQQPGKVHGLSQQRGRTRRLTEPRADHQHRHRRGQQLLG